MKSWDKTDVTIVLITIILSITIILFGIFALATEAPPPYQSDAYGGGFGGIHGNSGTAPSR